MEELLSAEALPWIYSVGLLVLGLVLVLLEIFVVPGFNIFGILGFGTVCLGVLFAYNRLGPEAAAVIGVLGFSGTGALVWLLIRNRAWQRMVREDRTDRASGYDSATGEQEDWSVRMASPSRRCGPRAGPASATRLWTW